MKNQTKFLITIAALLLISVSFSAVGHSDAFRAHITAVQAKAAEKEALIPTK